MRLITVVRSSWWPAKRATACRGRPRAGSGNGRRAGRTWGADAYQRLKRSVVPGGHGLSSSSSCAGGRVARSLSVIRQAAPPRFESEPEDMGFIPEWAIGVGVIIFAVALAQIVVTKLRASVRTPPASDNGIGELREAFDAMQNRVGELEERLGFTERLLGQHREADRCGPSPHKRAYERAHRALREGSPHAWTTPAANDGPAR